VSHERPEQRAKVHGSAEVEHKPSTAHFLCVCGKHVTFAQTSVKYTPLENIQRGQERKSGQCPSCGIVHVVRWNYRGGEGGRR
jgi:hypothetical protein